MVLPLLDIDDVVVAQFDGELEMPIRISSKLTIVMVRMVLMMMMMIIILMMIGAVSRTIAASIRLDDRYYRSL